MSASSSTKAEAKVAEVAMHPAYPTSVAAPSRRFTAPCSLSASTRAAA